jgi:hypothetical protein
VVAPDGTKREVKALSKSAAETRGALAGEHTRQPGVYQIVVKGEGNDPSGGKVSGEAKARVIVYDEDVEMQSAAANPAFLEKLAGAGEGEARRVEELANFFAKLAEQPVDLGRERWELRPDWATRDRSPFLVVFLLVFSTLVSLEWGLRRKWGMV